MRAQMFALFALAAMLGLTASAADPIVVDYKLFASSVGRYKVLFPGPVKTETTPIKAAGGDRTFTLDSVKLSDDVFFMVTYIDVPDDGTKTEPGPRLDKVRDGNKGPDGKVLLDREVLLGADKLPARDILIEKPALVVRNRAVIAGPRLYQVMLQGPKGFVTSREADRFFESFEVTK